LALTTLILLLALVAARETRAAAARPLRIAFLFTSGTMASLWMAKESGAFAKEGLDVEMISMGSTLALPALLANEVDVIQVSAAPVITASLRGFDVVFIAGMLNTMIWDLYARPEIKSAEQLRGKIVGTDRPGSPVAYGTLVALRKLGLSSRDVQLRPFGGSVQVASALQSGQIAAGAAGPPLSFHVERSGFHSLASTLDQPYQNVGLVVRRSRINELAPRLVPLLRSVREGIDRYYADKPFTLKVIPKYTRDTDADIIERTYEFYRKAGFRRELMISEPGMRGILNFLSDTVLEAKKAEPAQFFDDRFVRQLNSGK
jgi:ABC-type nitrate/sulfonate/bicarbonate transport system substrate-binding protein